MDLFCCPHGSEMTNCFLEIMYVEGLNTIVGKL